MLLQILEQLIATAGSVLSLHAPAIVDTLLNLFRSSYQASREPKSRKVGSSNNTRSPPLSRVLSVVELAKASRLRMEARRMKRLKKPLQQAKESNDAEQQAMTLQHTSQLLQELQNISDQRYFVQVGCITGLGKVNLLTIYN